MGGITYQSDLIIAFQEDPANPAVLFLMLLRNSNFSSLSTKDVWLCSMLVFCLDGLRGAERISVVIIVAILLNN